MEDNEDKKSYSGGAAAWIFLSSMIALLGLAIYLIIRLAN